MKYQPAGNMIPGRVYIAFHHIPPPIETQSEGRTVLTLNLISVSSGKSPLVIYDYRQKSKTAHADYQRDKDPKKFKEAVNSPALIGASKTSDGLHEHLRILLEDLPEGQSGNALLSIARLRCNGNQGCAYTECPNPEFWCWTTKVRDSEGVLEEIVVTLTDKENYVAINPPLPIHGYPEQVFIMRDCISLANKGDYFKEENL